MTLNLDQSNTEDELEYLPQWFPTSPLQIISPDPILAEIRDLLKQLIVLLEDQNAKTS